MFSRKFPVWGLAVVEGKKGTKTAGIKKKRRKKERNVNSLHFRSIFFIQIFDLNYQY